jgi:plasmid stability protein
MTAKKHQKLISQEVLMKAITIRGIEPELARALKERAEHQGKSVNRFVQDMLKSSLGIEKQKKYSREYSDLDHLFGRWSDDEYNIIETAIRRQREIDPELWV